MIEARNIKKSAGSKTILDDISFKIDEGSTVAFLGPSGSGKTSILRLLMGLEEHDKGELLNGGTVLSNSTGISITAEKRGFSFLFQEFTLFPHLNVIDNILIGASKTSAADQKEKLSNLLELLEIKHLRFKPIDALSGGEQQRIALVRALLVKASVLLLDEPFSNIDKMMRNDLYSRFKGVLKESGLTTIFATHDHAEAFYFSDKIYVLRNGRIMDSNTPERLYTRPRNAWVASFVGETNFFLGKELTRLFDIDPDRVMPDESYMVRPEEFEIISAKNNKENATVKAITFLGFYHDLTAILINGKSVRMRVLRRRPEEIGDQVRVNVVSFRLCPQNTYREER